MTGADTMVFDDRWIARRARLLTGRPLRHGAFTSNEPRIGLPFGLLMGSADRELLIATIAAIGDDFVGVTGLRDEFDEQPNVVVRTTHLDPGALATGTVLGHIEVALFGPSESWIIGCAPDGFSVLTATPSVLDRFANALGGKAILRARLDRSIEEGEYGSPETARKGIERMLRA